MVVVDLEYMVSGVNGSDLGIVESGLRLLDGPAVLRFGKEEMFLL